MSKGKIGHMMAPLSTVQMSRIYALEAQEKRAVSFKAVVATLPKEERVSLESFEAAVHLLRLHRHFGLADVLERHYGVGA